MKERWDFLKKSDKSLGLFYPMHYTIAGFENLEDADAAYDSFIADGFADTNAPPHRDRVRAAGFPTNPMP